MTRGHNIVADGLAGASNFHPRPTSPTNIQENHIKLAFSHFLTHAHRPTDQPKDQQTDRQTDKASYRVAQLNMKKRRKTRKKKKKRKTVRETDRNAERQTYKFSLMLGH